MNKRLNKIEKTVGYKIEVGDDVYPHFDLDSVRYLLRIARAAEAQQKAIDAWLKFVIKKYGPTKDNPKGRFTCDHLNKCDRLGIELRAALK